jgi:hypothetical protein
LKILKKIWSWIRFESEDPLHLAKQIQKNLNEPFNWGKFAERNNFFCDINNRVINIGDHIRVISETGNIHPLYIGRYGHVNNFVIHGYSVLLEAYIPCDTLHSSGDIIYFSFTHYDLEVVSFEEFKAWEILNS